MEGIEIICRRTVGSFLARPHLVLDGASTLTLEWNKVYFVPMTAGGEHQIVLQLASWGRMTVVARVSLTLRLGEIPFYEYRSPLFSWSGGCLRVLSTTTLEQVAEGATR